METGLSKEQEHKQGGRRLEKIVPLEHEARQSGELFRKNEQDSEKDWVWEARKRKLVRSYRKRLQSEGPGQSPREARHLKI